MESLLGLSFDNLSSRDSTRVHKGLRQIDGLLAQVCLSTTKLSPHKRTQSDGRRQHAACKPLRDLRKDAAFREFFRLQEGFQWNGIVTLLPLAQPPWRAPFHTRTDLHHQNAELRKC